MIRALTLWFFMAGFSIFLMTVSDYTRKMMIDQRRNMMMMGASIMLIPYVNVSLLYLLSCTAVTILLAVFMSRVKALGGSDVATVTWLFYGLSLISYSLLFYFFFWFAVLTVVYHSLVFFVLKTRRHFPFYPVIAACFFLTLFAL